VHSDYEQLCDLLSDVGESVTSSEATAGWHHSQQSPVETKGNANVRQVPVLY